MFEWLRRRREARCCPLCRQRLPEGAALDLSALDPPPQEQFVHGDPRERGRRRFPGRMAVDDEGRLWVVRDEGE